MFKISIQKLPDNRFDGVFMGWSDNKTVWKLVWNSQLSQYDVFLYIDGSGKVYNQGIHQTTRQSIESVITHMNYGIASRWILKPKPHEIQD